VTLLLWASQAGSGLLDPTFNFYLPDLFRPAAVIAVAIVVAAMIRRAGGSATR
jgi:hypothetical protein